MREPIEMRDNKASKRGKTLFRFENNMTTKRLTKLNVGIVDDTWKNGEN